MKVIVPKNSMAIDSKRAPIARGESVGIDETEIHETGRFKQPPTMAEKALAELGAGGVSRSQVRNEETFGQILMSSRDPCNLNELFDDKDLMRKKAQEQNQGVSSNVQEQPRDLDGEALKLKGSSNNFNSASRGEGSSGARPHEKVSKGGSSEPRVANHGLQDSKDNVSRAHEVNLDAKNSRDGDIDLEQKNESKPPLRTADNFYRTRAMQNPSSSYVQALGATPQGSHILDRQRANSLNLTAGALHQKNSSIAQNNDGEKSAQLTRDKIQPSPGIGGGRSVGGGRGLGSRENGSGSGGDRGLVGSREASKDGPRGQIGALGRGDRAEVFSQQMSFDNFNNYANRQNSQIQLSQGGGGFARGTIFKGGKEWRVGGMAANANPNQGFSSTNFKARMGQGQRYFGDSHSQYVGAPPQAHATGQSINEAAMRTQGVAQQQMRVQGAEQVYRQKSSDAGVSRTSFATHKRGVPRTLWQKGAVFSTKISRASVSAGKHIPNYHGAAGMSGGIVGGGYPYEKMPPQFGISHGTQGFYQQKYDQIAQQINQDITQNQRQNLKIHSNMSESGAYGTGPHSATKTTFQARRKVLDELQRKKNSGSSSQLNQLQNKGTQQAQQSSDIQAGNIEYSNTVFKNRPFSSENKYGNLRRNNQRNPNNASAYVQHNENRQYQGHHNPLLKDGDHFRGREFFDNNVRLNIQGTIDDVEPRRGASEAKTPQGIESDRPRQDAAFVLPPINSRPGQEGRVRNLITEDVDLERRDGQDLGIEVNSSLSGGPASPIAPLGGRVPFSPATEAAGGAGKTNYEKKEERMLSQRLPEIVWLRVYHVTSLNKYLLEMLGFGFYHTSVELYNHEFAYGGHDFDFSGIVCVETIDEKTCDQEKVRQASAASGGLELKERIPIGITYYSMDEIDDIVIYFGNFWHGHDYDPFSRNCNDFAQQFITHICDKEQFYYPSYVNRFTKLGSVLRGWFQPLQTIFGEAVELEHNEPEPDVDEWGYEIARDYVPVVGAVAAAPPSQPTQQSKQSRDGTDKQQSDSQPLAVLAPQNDYHEKMAHDQKLSADTKSQAMVQRQVSVITTTQPPAGNDYNQQSPREGNKKHEVFSPSLQKFTESVAINKTDHKQQNTQLDALLSSPKQNIKVSQIMDITQQQRVQVTGKDADFEAKTAGLQRQKSSVAKDQVDVKNSKGEIEAEQVSDSQPQDAGTPIKTGGMLIANVTNFMEEPVENIKQRADEHFALRQYQQAMKFYEICLGKITSVTDIDVNEDPYMMRLTIQTYLGICDSALGVGLPDRLVHFATQCIKVDVHNTSSEMHQVYKKRAQAFLNMGRYDQAREDLENALHLANNTTELDGQAEQVSQILEELKLVKEKILAIEKIKEDKKREEKAEVSDQKKKSGEREGEDEEEKEGASDRSFKDALDQLEQDMDIVKRKPAEGQDSGRQTGARKNDPEDQETELNLQGASNDPKDVHDGDSEYPAITSALGSKPERERASKPGKQTKAGPVRHKSFTQQDGDREVEDGTSAENLQGRGLSNSAFARTAKKTTGGKTMPLDLEETHNLNRSGFPSKGRTTRHKSGDLKQALQGDRDDIIDDDEDDKNTEEAKVDEQIVDTQGNDFGETEGYGHRLEF